MQLYVIGMTACAYTQRKRERERERERERGGNFLNRNDRVRSSIVLKPDLEIKAAYIGVLIDI